MDEKEVKEKIKERTVREKSKWKKRIIIASTLAWILLTFISTFRHPKAFTGGWVVLLIVLIAIIYLMAWFSGVFIFHVIEMNIADEEQAAFVIRMLDKAKIIEVKKRNVEHNEFFNDLQKRGKFYAKCIHEPETKVIVVYKYDGEEKELIFESLYPSVIFEKYTFEKND